MSTHEFGPCRMLWWQQGPSSMHLHGTEDSPHECGAAWTHGLFWGAHICKDCGEMAELTESEINDWDRTLASATDPS